MFDLFKKKSPKESQDSLPAQAVIVYIVFSSGEDFGLEKERESIFDLEDEIGEKLSDDSDVDGHEFGDGQAVMYIYGPDAEQIWSTVEPIVRKKNFSRAHAILRFGAVDDDKAEEKTVVIN